MLDYVNQVHDHFPALAATLVDINKDSKKKNKLNWSKMAARNFAAEYAASVSFTADKADYMKGNSFTSDKDDYVLDGKEQDQVQEELCQEQKYEDFFFEQHGQYQDFFDQGELEDFALAKALQEEEDAIFARSFEEAPRVPIACTQEKDDVYIKARWVEEHFAKGRTRRSGRRRNRQNKDGNCSSGNDLSTSSDDCPSSPSDVSSNLSSDTEGLHPLEQYERTLHIQNEVAIIRLQKEDHIFFGGKTKTTKHKQHKQNDKNKPIHKQTR